MTHPAEFDLQPRLQGTLLELRPLRPDDFDALFEAASDPAIWEQHPEPDRHTEPVFRAFFEGGIASGGALAVIERRSGRVIGTSRYANLDRERREIEIGWTFLERACWGGAHNGELKLLMVQHALRFVERVVFVVGADNFRSQRALEKIGARLVERTTRPDRQGRALPYVVFALARPDAGARPG